MKPAAYLPNALWLCLWLGCGNAGQPEAETHSPLVSNHQHRFLQGFEWSMLADTSRVKVVYTEVLPSQRQAGKAEVLDYENFPELLRKTLTGREAFYLNSIIADSTNFETSGCTFGLDGGFIIYANNQLAASIDMGCGYIQWNFHPAAVTAGGGCLNEQGYWKMQALLDSIQNNTSEQP